MNNILLLFLSLNSFASLDCASVDLNQLSDDKISEYTHCFKDAEVTISKTPKTTSNLKFTPVCDRSKPVKQKLEEIFDNSCDQITKNMLFAYDTSLEMTGQKYHKPKLGDFSGMNNLKRLNLNTASIDILPVGIFNDLENLEKLFFSNNSIEELPVNLFDKLLKLEELDLSFNNINAIPHGAFDNLDKLLKLSLRALKIEEVPKNIFDKLLKLEDLDLSFDNLKTVPLGAFDHLVNLSFLDLGGNRIEVISKPIINNPENSLVDLYLTGNPLTHIYNSAFKNMSQLRQLDLSHTELSIIGNSVFTPLKNIDILELSYIRLVNTLANKQTNEQTIYLNDISLAQFTRIKPFPLKNIYIMNSESLLRNRDFIYQLEEKGVNVVY